MRAWSSFSLKPVVLLERGLLLLPLGRECLGALLELAELLVELAKRSREAVSLSFFSASRSILSWMMRRSSSSSSSGLESICMRRREAASSIRSIALSGRKRSRCNGPTVVAAATSAASEMRTPWWSSYFSFRPRRIEIVSSTVGSPTKTGWKRRASAASFSICLRYSSSVVAPTQCKSPRASAGFSRLDASIAPSALPAPTSVCISSMNRMISPSPR
jgi:hypothetical protein